MWVFEKYFKVITVNFVPQFEAAKFQFDDKNGVCEKWLNISKTQVSKITEATLICYGPILSFRMTNPS